MLLRVALVSLLLVVGGIVCCNGLVAAHGRDATAQLQTLPHNEVALVLGTGKYLTGRRLNAYYAQRIAAAAALYQAGKAEYLLVSGDNRTAQHNEPMTMKRDLIALGIPAKRIYCDFAGFRTLDSIVRAREVFGQTRLTIVSQRFHNERALYLAQASGIEAVALDAGSAPLHGRAWLRETLACVQAVVDTRVLHRRPRFLGEKISIP